MVFSVGTTSSQTYLPGLSSTLTSILQANIVVQGGSYLPVEERIYSTGNWQRPNNISDWIDVTVVGGGGSGGKGASWNYSGSGGGGAGQYLRRIVNISSVAALSNIAVNIGQGGAAVSSGNTNGNDGGDTSFGTSGQTFYMIAYGGGGGAHPNTNARNGRSGNNGAGAGGITGGGSGGGGGGYWQYSQNGGGGGGGANGPGMNAFCLDRTNGTFYIGYMGGKGYGEGSSDGGFGVCNNWNTYHTHGGMGGPGINGIAGGGGGGGGTAGGGSCGGGAGGDNLITNSGNNGEDGTGSGGGGTYWTGGTSGRGGNGVIILRYLRRVVA